ncbi:Methyltransferase domain-containing protein [Asanoa hainanensis]|uniref:Methyltransferase domain-containing protein n=1 Tax=Asanoa hainanensis TaxID=560556 RepID=A0A239PBS1_9ACTN|nr:class I SAM-dependent methyltransferase [Asanoa hainanensis]SNT64557.1 Methyltransferase domain-containing protein [Asanoa hainanensis]
MINETRETYDLIAAEYVRRKRAVDGRLQNDLDALCAAIPPSGVVVDAGCGPGRELELLRDRGFAAVGVDLSLGQLRAGGQRGVAQADMRHLPLRTGSADAVWCQAALLHVPHAAVPGVLAEFARVVRHGGALYLNVAEGDGEGWEVASNYGSERRRWFTYHREADLTALLASAGFGVGRVGRNRAHRDWLAVHAFRMFPKLSGSR